MKRKVYFLQKTVMICLFIVSELLMGCAEKVSDLPDIAIVEALEGERTETARELTGNCVARLDMEQNGVIYYGSALLWDVQDEYLILVTAGHLLEQGKLNTICFPDQDMTEISIESSQRDFALQYSTKYDTGFLKIPLEWLEQEGIIGENAEGEIRLVSLHQRIFNTIDSYSDLHLTASSAEGAGDAALDAVLVEKSESLPEWDPELMIMQCKAEAGMSGGGVFDAYGHLVGMILGGNGTETAVLSMEKINAAYLELYGIQRNTEDYN